MKKILSKLCGGVLLCALSMSLTSCEDVLGHWEKPSPNPITPPSGGETPVTPEEIIYAFSLRNMADDADITAGLFKLTDQNGTEIAYATSDGKYTIKADDLSSVTTLWLEVTSDADKKYFAKATVEELPAIAEAGKLKMATLGDVILSDGKFAARSSTGTKVAMIAYLGSSTGVEGYTHGLALALTDEAGDMTWTDATGASGAAAHTPAAPTPMTSSWKLPSKDQWNKMIDACKNVLGTKNNYQDLRDGFSGIAGASNLQSGLYFYWSSTESDSVIAWLYVFEDGVWGSDGKDIDRLVRACLAF